MSRPASAGIALAVAAVLAAIGVGIYWAVTAPDSGTITSRRYVPAHDDTWTSCHTTGKTTVCVPQTDHYDACWQVRYRATNGRTNTACVSAGEYRGYGPGDHYPSDGRTDR